MQRARFYKLKLCLYSLLYRESDRFQPNFDTKNRKAEPMATEFVEVFEPYNSPSVRLENRPGYIDVVYSTKTRPRIQPQSHDESKAASEDNPVTFNIEIEKVFRA